MKGRIRQRSPGTWQSLKEGAPFVKVNTRTIRTGLDTCQGRSLAGRDGNQTPNWAGRLSEVEREKRMAEAMFACEQCNPSSVKGRIRQRSPGTWQISYEIGRDALGKRRTEGRDHSRHQGRGPAPPA